MNVIVYDKNTGRVNSVCALCHTVNNKYFWVSHKFGIIFGDGYDSREEAIRALDANPDITWKKCRVHYASEVVE